MKIFGNKDSGWETKVTMWHFVVYALSLQLLVLEMFDVVRYIEGAKDMIEKFLVQNSVVR